MTLQVAVLGIDGSGKSTLAQALPMVLSADLKLVAGSAGNDYSVFGPDQDHAAPSFYPKGLPIAGRIAAACRRLAKGFADNPGIYPYFKLAQMMFQDDAAASMARRYHCDVMVSDGNLILSATGRGGNYKRGASGAGGMTRERSRPEDLRSVYDFLLDGKPIPAEGLARLPSMKAPGFVAKLARLFGFDGVWVPDAVIFLDLTPEAALARVRSRGGKVDRHENEADMERARDSYRKALKAFEEYRGHACAHVIQAAGATPEEVLKAAVEALRPQLESGRAGQDGAVLGTPEGETVRNLMNPSYLVRYLLGKWFDDAWREPFFPASQLGRQLLREGYSAGVMRIIYDQDELSYGLLDRVFLGYPLHRAVYDRLGILTRKLEPEIATRLQAGAAVRIFTAPSGFAYDLFRPLESIAAREPSLMSRVELVAADLDPHGVLAHELTQRARKLGIGFRFVVGDITSPATQEEFARGGPYDIALFVGLSSWLPRPAAIKHLAWLREHLSPLGMLVTDCFSAAAYSLGGRYVGYRAHYYSPGLYRCLVDYSGFDGFGAEVESGRDRINHVLVGRPRAAEPGARRHGAARTRRGGASRARH